VGEVENPIVFTSAKENPYPGNWASVWFKENSSGVLKNVKIEYGGAFLREPLKIDSGAEIIQENVEIDPAKNILPQ